MHVALCVCECVCLCCVCFLFPNLPCRRNMCTKLNGTTNFVLYPLNGGTGKFSTSFTDRYVLMLLFVGVSVHVCVCMAGILPIIRAKQQNPIRFRVFRVRFPSEYSENLFAKFRKVAFRHFCMHWMAGWCVCMVYGVCVCVIYSYIVLEHSKHICLSVMNSSVGSQQKQPGPKYCSLTFFLTQMLCVRMHTRSAVHCFIPCFCYLDLIQ